MTKSRLQKIYGILLSISIGAAGLCLMAACLGILVAGEGFSREAVATAFQRIAFPVYLCLGLVALGLLMDIFQPVKGERHNISRQDWLVLRRLQDRTDLSGCDAALRDEVLQERNGRRIRLGILIGLVMLSCGALAGYLLSGDRFSRQDINGSVLGCAGVLAPCLAVCLGWALVTARKNAESCRREIGLIKPAAAPGKAAVKSSGGGKILILRFSVLALAVLLLVYGFNIGGAADVLTKAINICTECIGLG